MPGSIKNTTHIIHADDDEDDRYLFKKVLGELDIPVSLTAVSDGNELMQLLNIEGNRHPDLIFLDLNMPLKNGFECLAEIRKNPRLQEIKVIVLSTAYPYQVVNKLYALGASYFIRKPDKFSEMMEKIRLALTIEKEPNSVRPSLEEFVI